MRNKNTTSDLKLLRAGRHGFTWGLFHKFHDIGPYTLVEYFPFKDCSDPATTGPVEVEAKSQFHVYVDEEDCSTSADTLDQALIVAIAHKVNAGQGMACAACRVLGIPL